MTYQNPLTAEYYTLVHLIFLPSKLVAETET